MTQTLAKSISQRCTPSAVSVRSKRRDGNGIQKFRQERGIYCTALDEPREPVKSPVQLSTSPVPDDEAPASSRSQQEDPSTSEVRRSLPDNTLCQRKTTVFAKAWSMLFAGIFLGVCILLDIETFADFGTYCLCYHLWFVHLEFGLDQSIFKNCTVTLFNILAPTKC